MSKLYETVEKIIHADSMEEAENILYGRDGIPINTKEHYQRIISMFIKKKELMLTKNGNAIHFDLDNNIEDIWDIVFISEFVQKQLNDLSIQIDKKLSQTKKGSDERKELTAQKKNIKEYQDTLNKLNDIHVDSFKSLDNIKNQIEELKRSIKIINDIRNSFSHEGELAKDDGSIDFKNGNVYINNPQGKIEIDIPIDYLEGFSKGRIIAQEQDKVIIEKTNSIVAPILKELGYDISKIESFFYNVEPEYLDYLLGLVDYDITKLYSLNSDIFLSSKRKYLIQMIMKKRSKLTDEDISIINNLDSTHFISSGKHLNILDDFNSSIIDFNELTTIEKRILKTYNYETWEGWKENGEQEKTRVEFYDCFPKIVKTLKGNKKKLSSNDLVSLDELLEERIIENFDYKKFESFFQKYYQKSSNLALSDILLSYLNIFNKLTYGSQFKLINALSNKDQIDEEVVKIIGTISDFSCFHLDETLKTINTLKDNSDGQLSSEDYQLLKTILSRPFYNYSNFDLINEKKRITNNQKKEKYYFITTPDEIIKFLDEIEFATLETDDENLIKLLFSEIKHNYSSIPEELKDSIINLYKICYSSNLRDTVIEYIQVINKQYKKITLNAVLLLLLFINKEINPTENVGYLTKYVTDFIEDINAFNYEELKTLHSLRTGYSFAAMFKFLKMYNIKLNSQNLMYYKEINGSKFEKTYNAQKLQLFLCENGFENFEDFIYRINDSNFSAIINYNMKKVVNHILSKNILDIKEKNLLWLLPDWYFYENETFENIYSIICDIEENKNLLDQNKALDNKRIIQIMAECPRTFMYKLPKKENVVNLLEITNGSYAKLREFPQEFFTCDINILEELLQRYNSNIARSIFGVNNPKIISLMIYMNSVFRRYDVNSDDSKIENDKLDTMKICHDGFVNTMMYKDGIKTYEVNMTNYMQQLMGHETMNDLKKTLLENIRNASIHYRIKPVRDKEGKLVEDMVYLYDEDNYGNNNFNIVLPIEEAYRITREVEIALALDLDKDVEIKDEEKDPVKVK